MYATLTFERAGTPLGKELQAQLINGPQDSANEQVDCLYLRLADHHTDVRTIEGCGPVESA